MVTYYNTFTRVFSLLFGVALGVIQSYYGPLVAKPLKAFNKIIFYVYLVIMIACFIFIDASSYLFSFSMILVTLITCRLIDYGTISVTNKLSIIDKIIKSLSDVSYEIYLFQYPVIFLFQYIDINNILKIIIMIGIILLVSYLLHFLINFDGKKKKKCSRFNVIELFRLVVFAGVLGFSLYGLYRYYLAEDYSEEMNMLEEQLAENEKLLRIKQEEYAKSFKQEQENWTLTLGELENGEKQLGSVISNLSVVGVGDSVMLGAVDNLYSTFPNGYFDAKISRTAWVANGILQDIKSKGILGEVVVLNLGANGDCDEICKIKIMETCGDREVFWINVTNDRDVHVNDKLLSLTTKYDNLHVIDWNSVSNGHSEYFVADGIHLTDIGTEVYVKTIYDAIYQVYLDEYNHKKEETIKQYEENLKTKISFYGNNLLINSFDYIHNDFLGANFITDKDFDYEKLRKEIEKSVKNKTLTYKLVFIFDNSISLSSAEYKKLIDLCRDHEIYILTLNEQVIKDLINLSYENVKVINFYQEIKQNSDYLMVDGVHLTDEGNKALSRILNDYIIR